jgi:hypothetical protein
MNPLFIDIDDQVINVNEINVAKMQPEPNTGRPVGPDTPDVLVIYFRKGGWTVLRNTTKQELVETMVTAAVRGLPD